jgi:hypothetical protein
VHPQPVQVDTRRLGKEFATLRDEPGYLQVSYPCKVFVRLGKFADGA